MPLRTLFACALFCALPTSTTVYSQDQVQVGLGPAYKDMAMEKERIEIPITIASTQILVDDVFVNGQGPFRFMLDTGGMGGGRVDTSLAKKLELEVTGEVMGSDGTGRPGRQMDMHQLSSIEFAGMKFEDVRVLSRDYNTRGAPVRGLIDGILGFGLFKDVLVTIDYSNRKLIVEKGSLPEPDGKTVLSTNQNNVPGIELSIAGNKHSAHLDTGAMGWISVSDEVANSLKFVDEPVTIGQARTVTGAFDIKRGKLDGDVTIGSNTIRQPFIVTGIPLQTVNVGGYILRDFVVTYDQANQRIRVLPAAKVRLENAPESSRLPMQPVSVPMKTDHGLPVIEATINGKGPYKFVFDTGAGRTFLNSSLVKELGLKPTGKINVGDPSAPDSISANAYTLDNIMVGEASFEKLNAAEFDGLPWKDIKGIIGLPTFYDALINLDYPNQTMTVSRGTLGPSNENANFEFENGYIITFDMNIGDQKIKTHVDTGNMGTIAIPLKLAEKLPLKNPPQVIGRARTASGEFEIQGAPLDGTIEFAGAEFVDPMIHFNEKFDWGNIGSRMLKDHVLTIDQVNQRINLRKTDPVKKNDESKQPLPPRLGVAFGMTADGQMVVHEVSPNGLGEKSALAAGDVVVKVNGKPVADLPTEERNKAFQSSSIELMIERDGKQQTIKINR